MSKCSWRNADPGHKGRLAGRVVAVGRWFWRHYQWGPWTTWPALVSQAVVSQDPKCCARSTHCLGANPGHPGHLIGSCLLIGTRHSLRRSQSVTRQLSLSPVDYNMTKYKNEHEGLFKTPYSIKFFAMMYWRNQLLHNSSICEIMRIKTDKYVANWRPFPAYGPDKLLLIKKI